MVGPETPRKADDEIRRITTDLSARWGLRFPQQTFQSPAQRNTERPEEQVLSRLRFLFFHDVRKNQAATCYAVKCFERFAPKLLAGWVAKPLAEADVLPTRTRSGQSRHPNFLSKKPALNDEQASDLMRALLRYLDEAVEGVRKGAIFAIDEESPGGDVGVRLGTSKDQTAQSPAQPFQKPTRTASRRSTRQASRTHKDGNIKNYLSKVSSDQPPTLDLYSSILLQPSADEYDNDDGLLDDVEMQDVPVTAASRKNVDSAGLGLSHIPSGHDSLDSLGEQYHTPPDSPSKIGKRSSETFEGEIFWTPIKMSPRHKAESGLSGTTVAPSKKRGLPPTSKPEMPRKMSRDTIQRRSNTDLVPQTEYLKNISDPEFQMASLAHQNSLSTFHKSFSTESFSSVSSAAATKQLSAWTTPNTSFMTETPASSFDSTTAPFELDYLREKPMLTRRSWQNLKAPFGLGLDMDLDTDMYETAGLVPMGPPAPLAKRKRPADVSVSSLLTASPFDGVNSGSHAAVQLRQLYEVCRVSTQTAIPVHQLDRTLQQTFNDYDDLWSNLQLEAEKCAVAMPERSNLAAWKQSEAMFIGVAMTGSLSFVEQPGGQVFEFKLNPLKIEPSFRLARKFGRDRFFILDIPSLNPSDLPDHLRSDPNARNAILDWLVHCQHCFLGRKWRAFFVRHENTKKVRSGFQNRYHEVKRCHRVYLFAESGSDFQTSTKGGEKDPRMFEHSPMTRKELIDWFMPAKNNKDQQALKFFSRLALGISQTTPSIQLQPEQIIRSDDAFAGVPAPRHLDLERSHEKKTKRKPVQSEVAIPVMNDGCARISKPAAKAIANSLSLDHTPSIFQARIAGAKGVWMVDSLDEGVPGPNGDYWIEITDGQLKFEASGKDGLYPDPERVTFEVHSYSKPLVQASLNFQLMPILADRGVPFEVFSDLLEADLTAKVAELEAAMESGLAIRKWNQDVNSVTTTERAVHGVEMRGGLPFSLPEKINWFVEHGFEPKDCCQLKDLLYKAIADYCTRLENRMNIGIPRSTYAYMVADPLSVLEEGEVHIAFSSPFDQELMLHDIDLLVARLPAALPSDVQKVRAVFKVELKNFRDVIVFPSKGDFSLAEKLSGGDYDGDRAWVCWEPLIVEPFQNTNLISESPNLAEYGITTDTTKVSKFLEHSKEDYTSGFLRHAFDFTLQPTLLGICTSYHESFCYAENSISHPSAIKIAFLLGRLVDRAKAGIIFDETRWYDFLKKEGLPKMLRKPAYKDKESNIAPKRTHLIDRLVFETAKGVREKVLHNFSKRFKDVGTYDSDIAQIYKNECAEGQTDKGITKALQELKAELKKVRDFWSAHCSRASDEDEYDVSPMKGRGRRKSVLPFQALLEQVRDRFLAIRPSGEAIALSPIVARWARETFSFGRAEACTHSSSEIIRSEQPASLYRSISAPDSSITSMSSSHADRNHWNLLKASTAFSLFHNTTFVWYACGVELGILKAQSKGSRQVVDEIWECLKVNGKAVAKKMGGGDGRGPGGTTGLVAGEGVEDGEEDEYGDWGWVESLQERNS